MQGRVVAFAVLVGLVAGLAWQAPAVAGTFPKIQVAKKPDGPFQSGVMQVGVNAKRNLYVRLRNRTNQKQNVGVFEECGGSGCDELNVKWFRRDNDVSHSVQAGANGYEFKLKPDKPVVFRVKVTPDSPGPSACLYPLVAVDQGTPSDAAYFGINGNPCN